MTTQFIILIAVGYLLGAIPFGLLIAKAHGINLRSIGSGNIGTDLLFKLRHDPFLEIALVVGIDPQSEGLAIAKRHGWKVVHGAKLRSLATPIGADWHWFSSSGNRYRNDPKRIVTRRRLRSCDVLPSSRHVCSKPRVNQLPLPKPMAVSLRPMMLR